MAGCGGDSAAPTSDVSVCARTRSATTLILASVCMFDFFHPTSGANARFGIGAPPSSSGRLTSLRCSLKSITRGPAPPNYRAERSQYVLLGTCRPIETIFSRPALSAVWPTLTLAPRCPHCLQRIRCSFPSTNFGSIFTVRRHPGHWTYAIRCQRLCDSKGGSMGGGAYRPGHPVPQVSPGLDEPHAQRVDQRITVHSD